MIELALVGTQQGYKKKRIKVKIKNVQGGYRDLAFGIKGTQEISA